MKLLNLYRRWKMRRYARKHRVPIPLLQDEQMGNSDRDRLTDEVLLLNEQIAALQKRQVLLSCMAHLMDSGLAYPASPNMVANFLNEYSDFVFDSDVRNALLSAVAQLRKTGLQQPKWGVGE